LFLGYAETGAAIRGCQNLKAGWAQDRICKEIAHLARVVDDEYFCIGHGGHPAFTLSLEGSILTIAYFRSHFTPMVPRPGYC
jgi:hypothetical protein